MAEKSSVAPSALVLLRMSCLACAFLAAAEAAPSYYTLPSARAAFAWAREHLVSTGPSTQGEGACGWTRSTYAAGVWKYYAATGDTDARDDLVLWGKQRNYSLCTTSGIWTNPCAFNTTASCADNQLCAGTYIELYKAGLDLPTPHSLDTLRPIADELQKEIAAGSITDGSWVKVDLTYMAMAALSRLGAVTGDAAYFEKQWNNFNATMLEPLRPAAPGRPATFNLFNLTDSLFYQNAKLVGTDEYWGRGQGWAMLGLIDALRFGDAAEVKGGAADPHRGEYIRIFKLFAARLVGLQGSDGKKSGPVRIQFSYTPSKKHTRTALLINIVTAALSPVPYIL